MTEKSVFERDDFDPPGHVTDDELKGSALLELEQASKPKEKLMEGQQEQPDEQWKGIEEFDNRLIMENDTTTQVYWHSNSKSYDYTSNGWTSLANDNLLSIVDTEFEDLKDRYRLVARCRRHIFMEKGEGKWIEIDRKGAHEEMKVIQFGKEKGNPDPFALSKLYTKSQRNAYKAHLKGHSSITQANLMKIFKEQNDGKTGPEVESDGKRESQRGRRQSSNQQQQSPPAQQQQQKQSPPAQQQQQKQSPPAQQQQSQNGGDDADYTSTKRKEMFATFTEHKATLATMGIDEKVLAEGMYAKFEVKSRANMTAEQYLLVTKALRYVSDDGELYTEWISALGTEPDVGESEATAKIADEEKLVNGDDIPFDDEQPYGSTLAEQLGSKDRDELAKQTKALIAERLPELKEIGVDADMLILGAFVKYDVKPEKGEKLSKEQLIEMIESLSYTTFPGWIQNLPVDNSTNL